MERCWPAWSPSLPDSIQLYTVGSTTLGMVLTVENSACSCTTDVVRLSNIKQLRELYNAPHRGETYYILNNNLFTMCFWFPQFEYSCLASLHSQIGRATKFNKCYSQHMPIIWWQFATNPPSKDDVMKRIQLAEQQWLRYTGWYHDAYSTYITVTDYRKYTEQ